jgi:ADP-ribosylglycohydrolase
MVGGGPFKLKAGEWTDDTSMALCLAESLITRQEFDALDQMQRYLRWYEDGYLSSNGHCFDIGTTTQRALIKFKSTGDPFSGTTSESAAGNGCIMRLAPVPMYFVDEPLLAVALAGESSRTTHGAQVCVDSARYMAALLVGALTGASKDSLLGPMFAPDPAIWRSQPLHAAVGAVAHGSYKRKQPPEIKSTGFVIDCLECALWAFYTTDDFAAGALKVVNLGGDADTAGAVYGQIAGAFYGETAIPESWRSKLAMKETIERFADQLARR